MPTPSPDADRNLLFAVLALQADCLTQSKFVEACTLWASRKETPIADILAERGWLKSDDCADIQRLLERKLSKYNGDARAGIAEVTADAHIRQSLDAVPDSGIRATVTPGPQGHVLVSGLAGAPGPEGERYSITRLHATGGIGRVWLARDGSLNREVALKDLRPERAANPAVWGRFLREAQITGQLEHPGIVPIYELGRHPDNGQPFYTMRFVRGLTLREKILEYHQKRARGEAGPLVLRELLTAFVGVCNAIAYAHSRGVIHRDLKPANVVLGDFGEVMVLDWGLAKEMREPEPGPRDAGQETTDFVPGTRPEVRTSNVEATADGQVLGTPAYMAPEQADGRIADIDARTDVYGLGAILYELLTGRPPFTGGTTAEVLNRVRTLAPDQPRDIVPGTPPVLEAVCLKCLKKSPLERYAITKALADDVSHFLADEPTTAYREPLSTRAWRWARRHRSLVTSLVATLAVAVPILIVGLLLLNRSEGREREARLKEAEARERAQANYQRAQRAADALTDELARGIRPIAGTQSKTVMEILERAKQISDELLTDPDAPTETLERKARMLVLFTELYRETNRTVPARQSAEQSVAIFDRLLTERPGDRSLRIERAKAQSRLGWVLYDQGHHAESLAACRDCVAELEATGAESDPVVAAAFLASAYTYQANVFLVYGDNDAAEKLYQRGLDIRRKAAAVAGDNPVVRTQLALGMEKYGHFLAKYRFNQKAEKRNPKEDGLNLLREARKDLETLCAANPSDAGLHLQLVRVLTNLTDLTNEDEAGGCIAAGEKITERFVRHDPDHIVWQREELRFAYYRNSHRLREAGRLAPAVRWALRRAHRQVLEDIVAVIGRRNAQDPENHLWLLDLASMKSQVAKAYVELTEIEPMDAPAHLAKARSLVDEAIKHFDPLLARSPKNTEAETDLCYALSVSWQVERARKNPLATQLARWEYDVRRTSLSHRLLSAHPADVYWQIEFRRGYFSLEVFWKLSLDKPDWETLSRPEAIRVMLRVAAELADVPVNLPQNLRDWNAKVRQRVADGLRAFDAKGLLPAEGKKLLERFPPPEKK